MDFDQDLFLGDECKWAYAESYYINYQTHFEIDPQEDRLTSYMHVLEGFGYETAYEVYDFAADTVKYYAAQDKKYWVEAVK